MPRTLAARTFHGTKMTDDAAIQKDRTQPSGSQVMQHRHFAEIARIIREMDKVNNQEHGFIDVREDVAEHFAANLARTNDRFDRRRFMIACGFKA